MAWLEGAEVDGDPLADPAARDWAVRDYRAHLQSVAKRKPSTINTSLAAIADFYARYRLKNPARTRQLAEGIERVILELRPTFCRADWFAGFTPVVIRF